MPAEIEKLTSNLVRRHDLRLIDSKAGNMGEWYATMETRDFSFCVYKERGPAVVVEIGSKTRPKKGAPLRSWSLSQLRGFLDGLCGHYEFNSIEDQVSWFDAHESKLLQTELLNSESLRKWSVKAARVSAV